MFSSILVYRTTFTLWGQVNPICSRVNNSLLELSVMLVWSFLAIYLMTMSSARKWNTSSLLICPSFMCYLLLTVSWTKRPIKIQCLWSEGDAQPDWGKSTWWRAPTGPGLLKTGSETLLTCITIPFWPAFLACFLCRTVWETRGSSFLDLVLIWGWEHQKLKMDSCTQKHYPPYHWHNHSARFLW